MSAPNAGANITSAAAKERSNLRLISEAVFQRELNHARIDGGRCDLPKRRRRIERSGWIVELRVIDDIEEFRPELKRLAFGQEYVLDDRDVPIELARPLDNSRPGIAEQRRSVGRERRDRRRAERPCVQVTWSPADAAQSRLNAAASANRSISCVRAHMSAGGGEGSKAI